MSVANRTAAGWALIATGLLNVLIFALHPLGGDQSRLFGLWEINSVTHTLGVGLMPVLLMGFWGLAEWLGLERPVVRLALCCNLLAVVLVCLAGLTSGWITPVAYDLAESAWRMAMALNRACDRGYLALLGVGMILNGLALSAEHRGLRLYSLAIGLFPLLWLLSGTFKPVVHAMLALSLGQVAWWLAIGRLLLRAPGDQG